MTELQLFVVIIRVRTYANRLWLHHIVAFIFPLSDIPILPYVIFYARSDLLLPRTVTERYVMYAGQHIRLVSRVSCINTSHVRCMVNYSA